MSMRFNNNRFLNFIFLIISLLNFKAYSHDISDNHKLCLKALDYSGCINHNKSTISNNILPMNDFRQYGGITILWSSWQSRNDNHIAEAYNSSNQSIYIALNCSKQKINTTGSTNSWKGWLEPVEGFEIDLLDDVCDLE